MRNNLRQKLLQKEMTRKEFLQFSAGLVAIIFGLGNLIALVEHFTRSNNPPSKTTADAQNGFGSRKFGV